MITQLLATIILTIVFIPGVMYKIPKNYSKLLITCEHAFLFTIFYISMRTYLFNDVIESMVPNIEEESKSPDGNDMNEEEKKISNILSKLSVEKTKELSSLSSEQITALVKLVAVMEQNQIDAFLEMSMDKIKEMINEAMD